MKKPSKRRFANRLNDLEPKQWIKFQKSWFIHNPPPRKKGVVRHPAKFPETLAEGFIRFFTKAGQVVLDPMAGTGSTLIAALRGGRRAFGVELNPEYVRLARLAVEEERLRLAGVSPEAVVIEGDAAQFSELAAAHPIPAVDYVLTSPPYWDMLHSQGAKHQEKRRGDEGLDVVYSDHPDDLGNVHDYDEFLDRLVRTYAGLQPYLRKRAYLTIIVKNVKKGGRIYPLAWDLARLVGKTFTLKDEKIWLQDNQRLAPYGMGSAWVSNTHHHYCLQFRNE